MRKGITKLSLELAGLALAVAVGLFAFGVIDVGSDKRLTADAFAPTVSEHEGLGPAEPDQWFIDQRAGGPGKTLDQRDFRRAQGQAQGLRASFKANAAPRQIRGAWQFAGPSNVGGRITDLVVDVYDPGTVYVASASGGLWKSTDADRADGRLRMEQAWPEDLAQAMGAVAMGSDGRLWAGTGEPQPGGGSITFGGTGIFSSDDRGATWQKRGLEDSGATGEIVVDPTNPRRIFVAAAGSLFNAGGERGIYLSEDGGASWRLVLGPETPFAGGIDIAIHPSNPNRVYAAMWDHRREPDVRTYGGEGSGLFRSDDGGRSWTRLDNVLTYSAGDSVNGVPLGLSKSIYLGRIGLAIAPSNPNRVYVITTKTDGSDGGFYVSDDGGDSFNASGPSAANRPGSQGGFGWWFGRLWVDPADQNHLFVAGVNLRRSTNGGVTWSNSGSVHADQHALQWDPHNPGRVFLGNDGGTYRSDGNGASGTWRKAENEPYTQFYSIDVGERFPDRITGGAQDNGSLRSWQMGGPGTVDGWDEYNGGDGEYTLIDPADNDIFYGCSQYGNCARFNEGGAALPARRTISSGTTSQRRNWLTPIAFDPNDSSVIYYGGNVLNKSTNRGDSWTPISPSDPNSLPGTFEPGRNNPAIHGPYPNWGTITAVDIAKTASDTIYAGTDTGRLWKTENGGQNWTWFNRHGLPERWVTRVAIDPRDEDTVYATFSGFRNGEDAAHIYKTTNGGRTWANISGNLPNAPLNDVIVDVERNTVYVGGDVGVFYLKNGKKNWKPVGGGLPLAPVLDMRLHQPSGTLFTNTFGRSMWKLQLPAVVDN